MRFVPVGEGDGFGHVVVLLNVFKYEKSRLHSCKRPGYSLLSINCRLAVSAVVCALSYFFDGFKEPIVLFAGA